MIEITDKSKCCGCSACESACPVKCINLKEDVEGFLYPVVDKARCIGCNLCEKVCPVINVVADEPKEQKAYLFKHCDETIRKESTSGGVFSALATTVIHQGGVVFGVAWDEDFNAHHCCVETAEDLYKFRNSKYVQSKVGDVFLQVQQFLKEGRNVLFSGTPCQAEGLYHFLHGKTENLLLVDLVCHAIPSPLLWRKYTEYFKPTDTAKLTYAAFRDKSKYGYQYSQICVKYDNGFEHYAGIDSDPYMRAFFSNLSDRPSCYTCAFKKRYRVSDLTIWDCFDVYLFDKQFDDNKGVTRVLAHTKKGVQTMQRLPDCVLVEIAAEDAVKKVQELEHSVPYNQNRTAFFADCNTMHTDDLFAKWFPDSVKVKLERNVRLITEKLGIYRIVKRVVRKILGKE